MEPTKLPTVATKTEPSTDRVRFDEMEERFNHNLTTNISKNLQGYINDSIKGALDSMMTAIDEQAETNQAMINQTVKSNT